MKTVVQIDEEIKEIIPNFLEGREKDINLFKVAIEAEDFDQLESIGHKLKGNAGSYGFHKMSEYGAGIEIAAKNKELAKIKSLVGDFEEHFENIEIEYV
ncbi:MAG: Hpt domain-containing protein [Bdellovibrionota bacterium]|nr:Hpt domain-containing protein [Bdellovibrionota bacterium]